MCAHFVQLKAEITTANGGTCCAKCRKHLMWGNCFQSVVAPNYADRCVRWCTWMFSNPVYWNANWRTGQSVKSSVLLWMTVSCFKSFFCILNVNAMLLASSKPSNSTERRFTSLKNLIFCKHESFVCFVSLLGILEYSQEQQAKEVAPIISCTIDWSSSVTCHFTSSSKKGRAFCWICLGSLFW